MATMNVSLPDPMRDWVDTQVKGGEYANASDLIRQDQRRLQTLKAAITHGMESGRSTRKAEDVIKATKARLKNG
jgi:antitoxin ParD1/3/4